MEAIVDGKPKLLNSRYTKVWGGATSIADARMAAAALSESWCRAKLAAGKRQISVSAATEITWPRGSLCLPGRATRNELNANNLCNPELAHAAERHRLAGWVLGLHLERLGCMLKVKQAFSCEVRISQS
jgi:hypothetical protein